MGTVEDEVESILNAENADERRTLKWVLAVNCTQVAIAGVVGTIAHSTGLLGAALDNLGDAAVYAVSLYAVGRAAIVKARAARMSGIFLIATALMLLIEVIRRFIGGSEPVGIAMIMAALVMSCTNLINLRLLRAHRKDGVQFKASWIFTLNDMWANLGIVVSGAAVTIFNSALPDLLIGLIVAAIVIKGGWEILEEARTASSSTGARPG